MSTTPDVSQWPLIVVYGSDFRPALKEMADTIDSLGYWDWFKNEKPPQDKGYMYWGHPNVSSINKNLKNNNHSGATFGYALRCMQSIAVNGFDKWKNMQLQPE